MKETETSFVNWIFKELQKLDIDTILAVSLLVIAWIVIDLVLLALPKIRENLGVGKNVESLKVDKEKNSQIKNYISDIQGISGRPDAVIVEDGFFIPVERKPLAKTIHDRYKVQILIYMRLIEEFEGKKPPYGYLVLGPKCKQIKILNTDEAQNWVTGLINEMRAIAGGKDAVPTPHPRKCARCSVREHCPAATI